MLIFILFLLVNPLCFSEDIDISEYKATVEIFYCYFDIKTPIPLSVEELMKSTQIVIKQEVDKNTTRKLLY